MTTIPCWFASSTPFKSYACCSFPEILFAYCHGPSAHRSRVVINEGYRRTYSLNTYPQFGPYYRHAIAGLVKLSYSRIFFFFFCFWIQNVGTRVRLAVLFFGCV